MQLTEWTQWSFQQCKNTWDSKNIITNKNYKIMHWQDILHIDRENFKINVIPLTTKMIAWIEFYEHSKTNPHIYMYSRQKHQSRNDQRSYKPRPIDLNNF